MNASKSVAPNASDYVIVRNCIVVNARMIEPIVRSFGKQYSMLVSGELAAVGGSPAKEAGSYWLNANAQYPNGDPIKAPKVLDKHGRAMESELGEGSEISIAFKVVTASNGNKYYNLDQIRVNKFVKAFSVFDLFDAEESVEDLSQADESF
jgi:hypothetical protein